ncbi:MAG: hypothetical protein ABJ034_06125 [Hyphomicrobiales bacterium]
MKAKLIGDTDILSLDHNRYATGPEEGEFCYVRGSYNITNTGAYPFTVESVTIELYELPFITTNQLSTEGPTSYTLSERLQKGSKFAAIPVGKPIVLPIHEQFGLKNELQRSFGFIVPMTNDVGGHSKFSNYIVVANAKAYIESEANSLADRLASFISGSINIAFKPNDLKHITKSMNICQPPL